MSENLSQIFYHNVKNVCKIRKIRIGDVEKSCGFKAGYISRWRRYGMQLEDAQKIAQELKVPLNLLIQNSVPTVTTASKHKSICLSCCADCQFIGCDMNEIVDCSNYQQTQQKTNSDWIRSKTDEELADFLACAYALGAIKEKRNSAKAWLRWLKEDMT